MLRRPAPLTSGDPIAVVAPASPPCSRSTYEKGLARLEEAYDVRTAWRPGTERGYLAGTDTQRATAVNRAIRDPEIRAIICVRGGYGCLRLLPALNWSLLDEAPPTLLVGYSDITVLHLAFYAKARWGGLSGPVATEWAEADPATRASFEAWSRGDCPSLVDDFDANLTPIAQGTASGPLLGGNLSVLSRLVGTPYAPDFRDAILVLEDVAEAPYRIDRMLAHLQHAGVLDAVSGVVLGRFTTGERDPEKPTLSLGAVFEDYFGDRSYPVVRGLPYGHLLPRCSLPIGVSVNVRATARETTVRALSPLVA